MADFLVEESEEEVGMGKGKKDTENFTNKPSCILAFIFSPGLNSSENKTLELGIPTSMTYF